MERYNIIQLSATTFIECDFQDYRDIRRFLRVRSHLEQIIWGCLVGILQYSRLVTKKKWNMGLAHYTVHTWYVRYIPDVHQIGIHTPWFFGGNRNGNVIDSCILHQRLTTSKTIIEFSQTPRSNYLSIIRLYMH